MTKKTIHYKGWIILIYFNASNSDRDFLVDELISIGCSDHDLCSAYHALSIISENRGLTFANPDSMEIISVIGKADSKGEFINTTMHELYHCSEFIATKSENDDPEYPAYIMGDLSQKIYKNLHRFICDKCS